MKTHYTLYITGIAISLTIMFTVGFSAPYPSNLLFFIISGSFAYKYVSNLLQEKDFIEAMKGGGAYRISYDDLPTDKVLIGRGFLWTPSHTKQISALMQNKKMMEQEDSLGGLSFIHGIGYFEEKDIYIPISDLVGHMIYEGTTRVGKTRGYEIAVVQPIKRNETTIIIDPKGDVELLNRTVEACRKYGKEKDFLFFALPYPRLSAYYNPLKNFTLPNEIPDRIAMLLPSGGSSDSFRAFSWQVISAVNNALLYLGERPTLRNLYDYSLNKMDELCRLCIEKAFNSKGMLSILEDAIDTKNISYDATAKYYIALYKKYPEVQNNMIEDLISIASHPKEHFQKMSASLTPTLAQLSVGEIGHILSAMPDKDKQWIDWEVVAKKRKVVYMFFGSLLLRNTAKYVIRMTLQDFTSFIGARYSYEKNKTPINLFIDEFSEVVDSSFANMLNKCGGAGVRVTIASQSSADMEAELGSASKSQQIYDNLNIKLWMRTSDIKTAKVFSDAAGNISITQESIGFSASPDMSSDNDVVYRSSYSHSISEKSVPLVDPSWILKLPKGHGFLISGGRVFKVRIPLLEECQVRYLEELGIFDTSIFEQKY